MCQRHLLFVTLFVLNSRVPYNLTQKTSDTIRRPIKLLWMPQELLTIFVLRRNHREDKERNLSEEKEETVPFFSMSIAELISCLVGVLKVIAVNILKGRYLVWALLPKVWYQRSLRNRMARKYTGTLK